MLQNAIKILKRLSSNDGILIMNRYEITPDMSDGKKKKLLELINAREELKAKIRKVETKIFERCLAGVFIIFNFISVIQSLRNLLISICKGNMLLFAGLLLLISLIGTFIFPLILSSVCPSIRGYEKQIKELEIIYKWAYNSDE